MSGDIVLAGIAANDPTPNPAFIEVNFAQGVASGDSSEYEILLLGNKLSTASATPDTVVYGPDSLVQMQDESDVIALFGSGSELHRMWLRVTKINKSTTVRAIAITEAAGTAASATVAFSVTATAPGAIRTWVGDDFVDTNVSIGDTPDVVGAAVAANINNKSRWPVTAAYVAASSHTLTITAKQKGPRGNGIRFQMAVILTPGTTLSAGSTDTALSGGATADDNTAALATISPDRYFYIVLPNDDATEIGAAVTQVNTQALASTGIRQGVYAGFTGTLSTCITLATGRNAARLELQWQPGSDWTPAELAANAAAVFAGLETKPSPRTNYCNFGTRAEDQAWWVVPAPRDATVKPSGPAIKSALNNGISPIAVTKNGGTKLVNRITTRSLNGSQQDYRIRPAHKRTICDFFADDLSAVISQRFGNKKIGDDVPQGTPPLGSDFVTPDRMRGAVIGVINTYNANGNWDPLGAGRMKATLEVRRQTSNVAQMGVRIQAEPVENYESGLIQINQVS